MKIEKFRKLANSDKLANDLANRIIKKWNELTVLQTELQQEKTERNNHLQSNHQNTKSERNNTTIYGYSVPVCTVTGLPLHNHNSAVDYLTFNSVKWYFENDSKTFENKLESLLTDK
jgi:hypothetical protein